MRQCIRCGCPSSDTECFCGARTVEVQLVQPEPKQHVLPNMFDVAPPIDEGPPTVH